MNKYGIDHFFFDTIEKCDDKIASEREIYWIEYYGAYKNGYNATKGGDGKQLFNHGKILSRLKEYPYPKAVSLEFGCCADIVRQIAKNANIDIKVVNSGVFNVNDKEPVLQYSKDGTYIQYFNSTRLAAIWCFEQGLRKSYPKNGDTHISEVARNKRKTAYGYIWKYKKDVE